ncbi:MAG: hypothetical protein KKE69_00195 [Alphaproteobacteria bacterium]|nr:hypothetical protein [Alphaproteobacteria bacterium]MBU1607094.1 hypothetical protein [Alphaproteobacteria bacterium]
MSNENLMRKMTFVWVSCLLIAACYKSDSDLLERKNSVALAAPVFGYNGTAVFFEGAGESIKLCAARKKADIASCPSMGELSFERTSSGNYIVQNKAQGSYSYGITVGSSTGSALSQPLY